MRILHELIRQTGVETAGQLNGCHFNGFIKEVNDEKSGKVYTLLGVVRSRPRTVVTPKTPRQQEDDPKRYQEGFEIEKDFNEYNISSLWHITHRSNIQNIIQLGILNHQEAHNLPKSITDISNHMVQQWRTQKDPFYNLSIQQYAPLYIVPRNPMLYAKKDLQDQLCLIEIKISALVGHEFLITDGNAASRDTNFYNSTYQLNLLPWEVLKTKYWDDFSDGKRKMCSEVLVYPKVESSSIIAVHCYSEETQ